MNFCYLWTAIQPNGFINRNNMHLKQGSVLQGGKYRIEKLLGQGGFGITYVAIQSGLNRKVAIKEFFMKEHCNRDTETSHVSVPSVGARELVAKFKEKFIREAQMISDYKHPNIVIIHDVFEENGTAYYVMEYHDGGSLSSLSLPLTYQEAASYIRQVASALSYLHDRTTMHLDIKPSNVLIDRDGNAVLIDFGVSKRYDQAGHQTSSTPVGISHGYAPGEQYQQSTLDFSPATDIYSLGATFYKLVTGDTPPYQNEVNENGLPPFPQTVPSSIAALIDKTMQPRRKDRPQNIAEFLGLLDDALASASTGGDTIMKPEDDDSTVIFGGDKENAYSGEKPQAPSEKKKSRRWIWWVLTAIILVGTGAFAAMSLKSGSEAGETSAPTKEVPQHEIDKAVYDRLMKEASAITLDNLESCNKAIKLYEEAWVYEEKYFSSEYRSMFPGDAYTQIMFAYMAASNFEAEAEAEQARDEQERIKAEQEQMQYQEDLDDYNAKMSQADKKSRTDEKSLKEAKKLYEEAAMYEEKYKETSSASSFAKGASSRANDMQSMIDNIQKANKQSAPAPTPQQKSSATNSSTTAPKTGTHAGYEWVDLGLSVKWATCNVGASSPDAYGNYYAWGETSTKSEYYSSNSASYGNSWGNIGGSSSCDAARANWGGKWRLPTKSEFQELIDNCTWTWTTQNGHKGYKVTSKKNGQSIFLPAAGCRHAHDTLYGGGQYGGFCSSTPFESYTGNAYYLYFDKGGQNVSKTDRSYGRNVRPVLKD
jgi:serine/threonine protein kinase